MNVTTKIDDIWGKELEVRRREEVVVVFRFQFIISRVVKKHEKAK